MVAKLARFFTGFKECKIVNYIKYSCQFENYFCSLCNDNFKKTCCFWGKNCSRCSIVITHTEQQVSKNIEEDGPILKPYTHTFMLLHPRLPSFLSSKTTKYFVNFWWRILLLLFYFFFAKSLCGIL